MQVDDQDVAPLVEDLLRAVAVVIVDVEDGHFRRALVAEPLRGDGGVVDEAIAAHEGAPAWWPGGRQSAKAARSPDLTSPAPVSATSKDDLIAVHVPSTKFAPASNE